MNLKTLLSSSTRNYICRLMRIFIISVFVFCFGQVTAQNYLQTIRGKVIDKQSQAALPGASVVVIDSIKLLGSATDEEGVFKITDVPVGRKQLKISYLGYKETTIPVIVNTGKETIIDIELEESVVMGKEVVISGVRDKSQTLNEMATVSARSFTVEDTRKYAGSRNDPARMAANFAGVTEANDARNDIIIRGNSPIGLLYRLDGVDIPNPSHFGNLGSTGGPINILNNNVLDRSDFFTGAFPAEYGNAMSGVFDLRMRHGNNEKCEYMAQVGFNGIEVGLEGPFSKKHKASYLVNYRYSVLALVALFGVDFGSGGALPLYQDISFKFHFPTKKAGIFSLFGVGGTSYIELLESKGKKNDTYASGGSDNYFGSDMGTVGLSHTFFFSEKVFSKLIIAMSGTRNNIKDDSLSTVDGTPIPSYRNRSSQHKLTVNYSVNKKFSAKNTVKTGFILDRYGFDFTDSTLINGTHFITLRDFNGNSFLLQAYMQWQHRFTDNLSLTTGVHYQQFFLNNSYAVEPRIGLKWDMGKGNALSFGAGFHSQIQMLQAYFVKTDYNDGTSAQTNKNMSLSQSKQVVLAYDNTAIKGMRFKFETYFQYLNKLPVEQRSSYYSLVNTGANFDTPDTDSLVNEGTGYNYGLEFTAEKFYAKGWYSLFTTSLYESKYKGSDGVLRNTAFNGNYTVNFLGGKEFNVSKKKQNKTVGFDAKVTFAGGKRYIPINLDSSVATGSSVYYYDQAYNDKLKDYFRLDFKISFKSNGKKVTHEVFVDLQNILNRQNIFRKEYDQRKEEITTSYQFGIFPTAMYRVLF